MDRLEGKDYSVLLIESNPKDVALTLMAFETNGINNKVVVAQDGQEAKSFLFEDKNKVEPLPNLIILDLKLSDGSGLDILKAIRGHKRTQLIPVVILTTSNRNQDILDCYEAGTNAYVLKPDSYEGFISRIYHLGRFWLNMNLCPQTGL